MAGLTAVMSVKATSHDASFAWVGGAIALAVFSVVCAIVGIGEWLYARNASVFIDGELIGMTDLWGRRTTRLIGDLRCVELGQGTRSVGNGRTVPVATTRFVSVGGTTMFELRGKEFSLPDLSRLCDEAKVPLIGTWDAVASTA